MSSDHLEEPGETPAPGETTPAHRAPDGFRWRLVFAMILGAILVLLALIVLALYGSGQKDKADVSDQTLGDLAAQVQAKCAANPTEARKTFGDVCGKAKEIDQRLPGEKGEPGPPGESGQPGARGPVGPMGPTGPQGPQGVPGIQGPAGPRGPIGVAGQSPQCLLEPTRCVGPKGATGGQGVDGSVGPQGEPGPQGPQGDQGPAGTTGEQGPPGVTGPEGEAGKNGRGIADTDCQDDGTWLITYTDGTTDTARGPCRIVIAPPDPTPEAKKGS